MMTPDERQRRGEAAAERLAAMPPTENVTPSERYEEALSSLRRAEARVRSLAERLAALAQDLRADPLTLAPTNEAASIALPLHIVTHPFRREIDLTAWPDAESILEDLGALHAARSRALAVRAWMLPGDQAHAETP